MPHLNLKAKFAILAGTMILAVATIITTFLTRMQERTIRAELLHRAVALTDNLAYNCQLPLAAENDTSLRRLAQGLFKEGEVSYVQFWNADGEVLFQSGLVGEQALDIVQVQQVQRHQGGARSAWARTADGRTFLDLYTTVSVEDASEDDILATHRQSSIVDLGYVRVGMTAAHAEKQISHMRLLAVLLGVAIAMAGSFLAAALIHVMTRPLGLLMEGNRRVARGDFGMRLEVRSRDEFGRLASSYNQMAEEIQRSRELAESYLASLRSNAEHLEQANRALQRTNEELAKASRMKSEFLAVMSHELRTPLNVIIGFSEVMLDETFGALNQKQQRYSTNILSSGKHLLTLINDILDLSKVEAGKMQVSPSPFDLQQSIEEIQSLVRNLATRKGVKVECEEIPSVTLVTDLKLFKQVMFNLLSNAIKFTPSRGTVWIDLRLLDGKMLRTEPIAQHLSPDRRRRIVQRPVLLVEVRDNGIGIDPADHDKVFEAFQQVDGSYARGQEGTGLGLALTLKVVKLLGGDIWFQSARNEGTRFWFFVPVEFRDEHRSDWLELDSVEHHAGPQRLLLEDATGEQKAERGRDTQVKQEPKPTRPPMNSSDWPWGNPNLVTVAKESS